jgi:predicted dehydrogenase
MAVIKVPVFVRSATGRMTRRQHLERSLAAIVADGGLEIPGGDCIMPEPFLLGRREETLAPLATELGYPYSTDVESALGGAPAGAVYFEGSPTKLHHQGISRALDSRMHIYTEKPLTLGVEESLDLVRQVRQRGVCGGVVQDKRYLNGPAQLNHLIQQGLIGQPYHVSLDFGYLVHPDDGTRPDWNSDVAEGGGIILDMVSHWDYLLKHMVGQPRRVNAHSGLHIKQRTRNGQPVPATAEDSVYATFEAGSGVAGEPVICTTASSWCRRPRKRGLLEIRVQGTLGAAEAYLDRCYFISNDRTPAISWDPDAASREDFLEGWERYEEALVPENAFRHQWELFLRHIVTGSANPASLLDGAQGVETATRTLASAQAGSMPTDIRNVESLID